MKNFINNFSTSTRLILSFAVILILMAVVIIIAYLNLTGLAASERSLHDDNFQKTLKLEEIRTHINFQRGQILEMMQISDLAGQQSIEQTMNDRELTIDAAITTLKTLDPATDFQSKLQELKNDLSDYRKTREQEITLVYAGKSSEAQLLGNATGADQYEKVRALTVQMGDNATTQIEQQLASDQQAARSATITFIVIGAIAILLAIGLVVLLNQSIALPLTNIAEIAEQIGAGDLTVDLPSDQQRRDEIGGLIQAFRQMVATLRRSTANLSEAVGMLGSSASEILAATTQVATGTAESSISINETTTTVEEVRLAAQLSSDKAQYVSDSAQRVAQISLNGQKAVEAASGGMDRIREQMEIIAQTVVRLSEQSQSIGGIIATVTDLADQSNLLAVNAAIEAARAGEQGRGFAVVAQEIKSLAEQSKQATAQVRGILNDVQKATSNAVMATEQGSKAVESGVLQAAQAGEAIQALAETSSEAVQNATQIVASSQQQVVGMDQIGVAMENINQAGSQNAASMKQMEVAARNLHELGEKLKELITQYKV